MKYFITGHTGFVGSNFLKYIYPSTSYKLYHKNYDIEIIDCEIVLHFAGIAHDLSNTNDSKKYYDINTNLTKNIFDKFLNSNAKVFIFLSSVKAVKDDINFELTEETEPAPKTHYGISKHLAEKYILSKIIPSGKRVYILRPCMIHGPGNKGNFNLLFNFVNKGYPWPLGSISNKRSFCSLNNLLFIINELINNNNNIPTGIYNVADDEPISTTQLINLIAKSINKKQIILNIPFFILKFFIKIGDILNLPFNTERYKKLTQDYVVNNNKIKKAIKKNLPYSAKEGLLITLKSFYK